MENVVLLAGNVTYLYIYIHIFEICLPSFCAGTTAKTRV